MKLAAFRMAALPLAVAAAFPASVLAQAATSLTPVTVSATRFTEAARSLPLGVSVVTADEIRASGATTVNEAVMRVLGVPGRLDLFGGGDYSLDLRGFGGTSDSNQVIVVDGQRLSEADLGGTRLAGIPIDSVERIEVLRGSGAVLYGEGATGGVIVITTKAGAGRQRANAASVYGGVGSFHTRDARAGATLASGAFSFDANAQSRRSDNHRDNFASDFQAGGLTAQWSGEWLRLGARYAEDKLDTRLPGGISHAQYLANPRQTNRPNDRGSIRNQRTGFFANADLGGWQLAFDANERSKALRSLNSGFPYDYDVDADSQSLRARHEGKLGAATNVLVLGVDRSSWEREVLGAFGSRAQQESRAFYAKDDVILAGGTRISAGWRTERVEKEEGGSFTTLDSRQHAWELGASHPISRDLTGYVRAGRSFRLANVDEFSYTSPGVTLKPQVSRDVELGARWKHAAGSVDGRLYRSRLENEIGFDPNAAGPFGFPGANANFDPTRRQGLEIDAVQAVGGGVQLRLNAAWRDATFTAGPYAGKDVPLVPRHTVALRADWSPMAGHRLSGGVNWVSSSHSDFNNACTVPAHTLADARYAFQWRQVEFAVGISNLFDRKYYTLAFGCAAGSPTSIYPEAGRAVTASVRAQF